MSWNASSNEEVGTWCVLLDSEYLAIQKAAVVAIGEVKIPDINMQIYFAADERDHKII